MITIYFLKKIRSSETAEQQQFRSIPALQGIAKTLCVATHVSYAFVASDGGTTLSGADQLLEVRSVIYRMIQTLARINHTFRFRLGKEVFRMSAQKAKGFFIQATDCALRLVGEPQLIADYQLHTINYCKFTLL